MDTKFNSLFSYDDIKNDFSEKFKRGNFKKSLDAFMKAF